MKGMNGEVLTGDGCGDRMTCICTLTDGLYRVTDGEVFRIDEGAVPQWYLDYTHRPTTTTATG